MYSRWSRYHGRPLVAQFSVLSGIPVAYLTFMVIPPRICHNDHILYYAQDIL